MAASPYKSRRVPASAAEFGSGPGLHDSEARSALAGGTCDTGSRFTRYLPRMVLKPLPGRNLTFVLAGLGLVM